MLVTMGSMLLKKILLFKFLFFVFSFPFLLRLMHNLLLDQMGMDKDDLLSLLLSLSDVLDQDNPPSGRCSLGNDNFKGSHLCWQAGLP